MKKYLLLLSLLITSLCYSQNTIFFECYKVNISELNSNNSNTKEMKIHISLDLKNHDIGMISYDQNNKANSTIKHYFNTLENEDKTHSFFIINGDKTIVFNFDFDNKTISMVDDKYYIFYYNKYYQNKN